MDYEILKGKVNDTFNWGFATRNANTNEVSFECTEEEKEWIEKWSGDFKDMVEEAVEDYEAKVVNVEFEDLGGVLCCTVTFDKVF